MGVKGVWRMSDGRWVDVSDAQAPAVDPSKTKTLLGKPVIYTGYRKVSRLPVTSRRKLADWFRNA